MNPDDAYESLADVHEGDARWAFGTGFDDPLHGVDRALPDGADAVALARQCRDLGDDALVLSQRLAAWTSNAPELEDELALANIALDLLGSARLLLTRAAQLDPDLRPADAPATIPDEDALAYFRSAGDFRVSPLAVLDDGGDFATAIARLVLATLARQGRLEIAAGSVDPVLAAVAAKGLVEARYHAEYAAGWLIRLGDGTPYSHGRMQDALDRVWPALDPADRSALRPVLDPLLVAATLHRPASDGGTDVVADVAALAALLTELQSVARADPAATW